MVQTLTYSLKRLHKTKNKLKNKEGSKARSAVITRNRIIANWYLIKKRQTGISIIRESIIIEKIQKLT